MFILLSLLCIAIIASKLQVIRCRCLSQRANKLALMIVIIVMIACASLLNLVGTGLYCTAYVVNVIGYCCIGLTGQ